jgi:cellulose synthase/poly-beta-1,6-N-acetylglucosamine synthase-like glycosyltransferase
MLIFFVCLILTLAYLALIIAYRVGWQRQKTFILPAQFVPSTFISVIIPARNEGANIGACIESVLAQKYPLGLYEIIVVDDHSDDDTASVVNEHTTENVRYISLADHLEPGKKINSYKKAALATGIKHCHGALIVTTDADCTAPNSWLMHIAAIYEQKGPVMIVAPVIYNAAHRLLPIFQAIDFMGMQGITAAAHSLRLGNMSNGANLAFSKQAFDEAGGYEGIDHMATGDDYLLMMKLSKYGPGRAAYLKSVNAIVSTHPQPDWRGFIAQRVRWASKSGKYKDFKLTGILLFVYLFNLSFLALSVGGFFNPVYFYIAAAMLLLKIVAEYFFLAPVSKFFSNRWTLVYFPILQPLHIAYIVCAGFLGFVGKYQWKGRMVK